MTDLIDAIRGRRSTGVVNGDAPGDEELRELLELAMCAPDHGCLRPWRLVLVRGEQRVVLGQALAVAAGRPEEALLAGKTLRAPLLIGIVLCPRRHPRIPEWEQLAAVSGVVTILALLLHGRGWASIWRTGTGLDAAPVRAAMQVHGVERLLGWLYVGGLDPAAPPRPEREHRLDDHLHVLAPSAHAAL